MMARKLGDGEEKTPAGSTPPREQSRLNAARISDREKYRQKHVSIFGEYCRQCKRCHTDGCPKGEKQHDHPDE